LQATVEGQVLWLTRAVAQRLQTQATFPLLTELLLYVPDQNSDPALRAVSQEVIRRHYWASAKGLDFIGHLLQDGELYKQLFIHPPTQAAWIERPELYRNAIRGPDLQALLWSLRGEMPPRAWRAGLEPWTTDMVRQAAEMLGEGNRAQMAVRSWQEGRLLVWNSQRDPGRQVAVSIVRFETSSAARAYWALAIDLERKQDQSTSQGLGMQVVDSRSRALQLPEIDEAVWLEKKLQLSGAVELKPVTRMLARSAGNILEIAWFGEPGDEAWAKRLVAKLMSR
jgi:hypothetical protein